MREIKREHSAALSSKGTPLLGAEAALELLDYCDHNGFIVNSVEAYEIDNEGETLNLEYSYLGLDVTNDASPGPNEIVRQKIRRAAHSGTEVRFQFWVDEASE